MRRIAIKVCGVTEERDAIEAALLGADAIGLNFWPKSPRYVKPAAARRIVERLPLFMAKIGVFVNEEPARIREIVRDVGLTAVQLHGDETPESCAALFPLGWYKALRVGPDFKPEILGRYTCTMFLLDGWKPGVPGGTGKRFDWSRARNLSIYGRILLAGGLDPSSVEDAIVQALPYGVDVASGVEFTPGKKDLDKLEAFVAAVRRAEERIGSPHGGTSP